MLTLYTKNTKKQVMKYISTIFLFLLTTITVSAQEPLVTAYQDSLQMYRQRLDSLLQSNDSLKVLLSDAQRNKVEYSTVTSPLTYNRDVTARLFSRNRQGGALLEATDEARMRMYLKYPELVSETDKQLKAAGTIDYKTSQPILNELELTEEADTFTLVAAPVVDGEQLNLVSEKPNFWTFAGDYSLQIMQNYVSDNWYKGGHSSLAAIGTAVIQANYNDKEKVKWENKLEMKLGFQTTEGDDIHKYLSSEDLLRLTNKLGFQATKNWYYTFQSIAQTQMVRNYKSNDEKVQSDFFSPFNLNLSLGMEYKLNTLKGKLTGSFNISPLSANLKYVGRLDLAQKYGLDEDEHSRWDLGSTFTGNIQWKFSDSFRWESRLYAYTSYHRMEMEWENTFTFQLTKYISTKIFAYPRFDDSAATYDEDYGFFQFKEYLSFGFNYTF